MKATLSALKNAVFAVTILTSVLVVSFCSGQSTVHDNEQHHYHDYTKYDLMDSLFNDLSMVRYFWVAASDGKMSRIDSVSDPGSSWLGWGLDTESATFMGYQNENKSGYFNPIFSGQVKKTGGTGPNPATYEWTIHNAEYNIHKPELIKVVFNGVNSYHKDPDSGNTPYQPGELVSPQDWEKDRGNDPAVFYSSNSSPALDVVLSAKMASGIKLSLKGTGPDGILAQCNNVTPNVTSDQMTVSGIQLTGLTGKGVKYFDSMSLSWQASINGGAWFDVGTSSNEMYVSLKKPTTSPVVTEVHIAVKNAVSANSDTEVISKLVAHFKKLKVEKKGGAPLTYYMQGIQNRGDRLGLIYNKNGRCNAWADLFVGVLRCHRVSSQVVILDTVDKMDLGSPEHMQIMDYNLAPNVPGTPQNPYPSTLTRIRKLPGQNNGNPMIDTFPNHYIVEINANYFFDPSYGIEYKTNRTGIINNAFINSSVSAFGGAPAGLGHPVAPARKPRNDGTEIKFR